MRKLLPSRELLEEWEREDREAREIRRRSADWDFIEKQPPRVRLALLMYIETGDIYKAARLAEMSISELNELRRKAGIPAVT